MRGRQARMKATLTLLLLLALPLMVASQQLSQKSIDQAASKAIKSVTAQIVKFNPVANTGILRVTNSSQSDITAFTVAVTAVYASGYSDDDEKMDDFLPRMISQQVDLGIASPEEGAFHPGQSQEEPFSFTVIPDNPVVRVDTRVEVVAYADRTVEVNNEEALGRLLEVRKGGLLAKQEAVAIIRKRLNNFQDAHPIAGAATDIQQLHDRAKAQHTGELGVELDAVIQNLHNISPKNSLQTNASGRERLSDYAGMKEREASFLLPHTQLRRLP